MNTTKVFVWELCCSADANKSETVILKLNGDDGDRLKSLFIVHDKKLNKLLFKLVDYSSKKNITFVHDKNSSKILFKLLKNSTKENVTTVKQIALSRNNEKYITFYLKQNGILNIYINCNHQTSNKESDENDLESAINLKDIFNVKSFKYSENVYVYDDLKQIENVFKSPIETKSVLDGSILYFYDNFNLINHGANIISFEHDSKFYSICYKNNKKNRLIEITSKYLNSETKIQLQLNQNHNFRYGLYLYFKCSSIEIYDSCPSKNSSQTNYVGVWNTSIFADSIFIQTYRNYISSNGAFANTLEMFCNNSNLFTNSKRNIETCSSVNKNIFQFDETNKIMNKYMPPTFNKYLSIISLSNLEGSIYLKNNLKILVASRHNSKLSFFNRSLTEYEEGFTDGQFNFWLGLSALYKLTHANKFKFKIVATTKSNFKIVEDYSSIGISNLNDKYKLTLGKINTGKGYFANYNNSQFSTFDFGDSNLARKYLSGFWHKENTTLCFNCVDEHFSSTNSSSTNGKMFKFDGKSVMFNSVKMYLVVN